jgi:hypothetical protein
MRKLTDRDLATILHGLRLVQELAGDSSGDCRQGTCEHFDEARPLAPEEIDELCEAINLDCWIVGDHELPYEYRTKCE